MSHPRKPTQQWSWSAAGTRWSTRKPSSSRSSAPDPPAFPEPSPANPPPPPPPTDAMANRRTRTASSLTPSLRPPSSPGKTSSSLSPAPTSPAPPPPRTNIEIYNARRRRVDPDLDAKADASRALLHRYLAEMQKTHAYIVRSTLAAARLDLDARAPTAYDAVSPFAHMAGIEIAAAEAKERRCETGRFALRFHGKAPEQKILVPATASVTPRDLAQMPKYHSYTTLRNNILAEDDEVMRYFPYFGEDAEEDEISQLNLEETFVDRTKASAEDGRKNEYAAMYTTFLLPFLADHSVSLAAVTAYLIGPRVRNELARREALPDDFDFDDPKVRSCRDALSPTAGDELDRAEPVCRVWKQETGISLWEVVKRVDATVRDSIAPARVKVEGGGGKGEVGGNPAPFSLESYAALNCLLCFMHECPFHVNKDHDRLAMAQAEDANDGRASKKDNTIILKLATNVPGWAAMSKGGTRDPWGGENGGCSDGCFLKGDNAETAVTGEWSAAQIALLRSSAGVLKNNARCACLIASIINKPCAEINRQLLLENLLTPANPTKPALTTLPEEPSRNLKRKKPMIPPIPGYPPDCHLTHTHEKRTAFQACRHLGHCSETCPCVVSHVTCEKSCICSPSCPRRWRGCACKREGRACTKESCICVKANRECDVDLCHTCGATDALDPMNRYGDGHHRDGCQNVWLQRDTPKRTLLGRSAVAGFGLFMGEDVKAGAFLGEYKGEVITSDEADRRGKLYDKRGVSFLFNLNLNQVIDATRAGNKFRYVNHSGKRPNCGAKVLMAGCTHRIGMFARRDLRAGEELFFDYGYNNKQVKFVQKEFEPPEFEPAGATAATAAAANVEKKRRRAAKKRDLDYLKGGKGTTERSRARATGSSSAAVAAVRGATTTVTTTTITSTVPAMASVPAGATATAAAAAGKAVTMTTVATASTVAEKPVRVVKSAEYVHDSEDDTEDDLGQEDEGTEAEAEVGEEEEEVDEEYEPDTEESAAIDVVEVSSDGVEDDDDDDEDDEPPRRPGGRGGAKRMRSR